MSTGGPPPPAAAAAPPAAPPAVADEGGKLTPAPPTPPAVLPIGLLQTDRLESRSELGKDHDLKIKLHKKDQRSRSRS